MNIFPAQRLFYQLAVIVLIIVTLSIGKVFFIPLTLAVFLGLLLNKGESVLRQKVSPAWSKTIVISIYLLLIGAVLFGLGASADYLQDNMSSFTQQLDKTYKQLSSQLELSQLISVEQINQIKDHTLQLFDIDTLTNIAGGTLTGLAKAILIIVLSILLLTHEQRIRTYISAISGKVGLSTLEEIKQIIRQYTLGLFFLMLIVFVLYVIGLLIAGVPYAVLIAAISAFATIVPTVGTFLGGMFAVIVSGVLTGSIIVSIIICGRYILIQQLEEYFILPRVVGSRVSLNVLVSIISIVARGMLWGVAGIFLAIPIMGVVEMLLEKHGRKVSILLNNKKTEQQGSR